MGYARFHSVNTVRTYSNFEFGSNFFKRFPFGINIPYEVFQKYHENMFGDMLVSCECYYSMIGK